MTLLSICIPTYNRAQYIGEALQSIFEQTEAVSADVEVLICDNNSKDNTQQVAAEFAKKYGNLHYYKNDKNIGFDGNMLKVFSLARGQYTFVMGDDDTLKRGAIARMLEDIKSNLDLYIYYMDIYDQKMRYMEPLKYLKNFPDGTIVDMANDAQLAEYLKAVRSNSGLFGHIGGFLAKTEMWNKVPYNSKIFGLQWIHVYNLWYFRNFKSKFKFSSFAISNVRSHNDETIKQNGVCARLLMEVKALYIIAGAVFADNPALYNAFLEVVSRYFPLYTIPPLFAVPRKEAATFYDLTDYLSLYPYPQAVKFAFNCPVRVGPLYFLRIALNKPALRYIKKPVKFIKDLF